MNYVVTFKKDNKDLFLFFKYRDESDITASEDMYIRDENDVIRVMLRYIEPDNGDMVIRETLLDLSAFRDVHQQYVA